MLDLVTIAEIETAAQEGQIELSEIVRGLVQRNASQVYETLCMATTEPWLEPSLFAWFTHSVSNLDLRQVLYRWLSLPLRPQSLHVPVSTFGAAMVPGVVVFERLPPNSTVEVSPSTTRYKSAGYRALLRTPGVAKKLLETQCGLEVCDNVDAQLESCLSRGGATGIMPVPQTLANEFFNGLSLALRLLRETSFELHQLLGRVNRRVYFYQAVGLNSFASISFHGACFLNVPRHATTIYFLDDYAHQGGHVVFNAATLRKEKYLAIPAETPLREVGGPAGDPRNVYAAFHGLFTYSTIVTALGNCYVFAAGDDDDVHELRGRLAFTLLKFRLDLKNLSRPDIFTVHGRRFYESFRDCYARAMKRYQADLKGLDLSNQPYSFDYGAFLNLNPLKKIAKKEAL